MRLLRFFFWVLAIPPLLAGGPACAQAPSPWQPATSVNTPPQAVPVPRPTPVQVAPLASPTSASAASAGPAPAGWATAPAASKPAESAPPALRPSPLTETRTAAPQGARPADAPALRFAPLTETNVAVSAPVASPAAMPVAPARGAQVKIYGPQKLAFAEGVSAQFDVTYQTLTGFRPLTLDLYQPRARDYPLPLVVFVHGGGDTRHAAAIEDFPVVLAGLAAQGYVIASVNYRLSGEARFPAALQDLKTAIRWLRGRAGEYGIDTTRVAVWGVSSGGQLASLAGVACGVPLFAPAGDSNVVPSDCVQAVINWYGATDLKALADAKPVTAGAGFAPPAAEGDFLGCDPASCPPALARIASPLSYISVTSPPFLIVHGGADTRVPPDQSRKFHAALRAKNVPAELVIYPEVGHDLARDGGPDAGVNRQAMEKVAAFLARTFPPGPISQKVAGPRGRGPVY